MNREYVCYCGLYCGNCAVKVKVEPASKILYEEMRKEGFEDIIHMIPDGDRFWSFLGGMVVDGVCVSYKDKYYANQRLKSTLDSHYSSFQTFKVTPY